MDKTYTHNGRKQAKILSNRYEEEIFSKER